MIIRIILVLKLKKMIKTHQKLRYSWWTIIRINKSIWNWKTEGDEIKKQQKIELNFQGLADGTESNDAVNKSQLDAVKNSVTNQTIGYKATDKSGTAIGTSQTVALTSGLNFKSTDNITTSVEANGVVKHTLNNKLTGITEIKKAERKIKGALKLEDTMASLESAKKDNSNVSLAANAATLSAGNDKANVEVGADSVKLTSATDKTLTYNKDGKLSGLEAGEIAANSKEAITGNQLNDLGSKLGLEVDANKTQFESSIQQIKRCSYWKWHNSECLQH